MKADLDSVYLAEWPSPVELDLLHRWRRTEMGSASQGLVSIPHPRDIDVVASDDELSRCLLGDKDLLVTPVRVVWLPKERHGERTARFRDLVLGDPRHPRPWRQQWLRRMAPDRFRVITGEPASLSELRARYVATRGEDAPSDGFPAFVARQASLALERAEYRALGARYKVPKFVKDEIVSSVRFRSGVRELATSLGRDEDEVRAEAIGYLDEMVTGYSQFNLDLMVRWGRVFVRPGYGAQIDYDPAQVERVRAEMQRNPAVVLPSHKSNLDALVTPIALFENGLARTHTFAGINMDIWPLGPLMRRSGRIFIRRTTKDLPVYRWVLREYIGYVVEKRFTLEWYVEGGRSRTGKLLPPKMGLLRYVVDAVIEGRTDDVALLPMSIIYDELHEVSEFSAESRGATKKAEGLGWMVRFYRGQKGNFGKIYVRFGEPLSLRASLGGLDSAGRDGNGLTDEDRRLELKKLAFEVSTRINAVTPITASALICFILLATRGRALTAPEIRFGTKSALERARLRHLPLAESALRVEHLDELRTVLESMATNHVIAAYEKGEETVYSVALGQHHSAAFYRNTIIHFFVDGSIAELALVHAAEATGDRLDAFWDDAFRQRDLLKFDFFFEQKEAFRKALATELTERLPGWEDRLTGGTDPIDLLNELQPLQAFCTLRPFLEAYATVAQALLAEPTDGAVDDKAFLRTCLGLGEQMVRQHRLRTPEAVSKQLLETGLQLAANRRLTVPGPDLAARRAEFVDELTDLRRRIDVIESRTYAAFKESMTAVPWSS